MKAVLLDVPAELLEARRTTGADRWDEVWEGVLHMVPPPSADHQHVVFRLGLCLAPMADELGCRISHETGLWAAGPAPESYRIPDLVVARPGRLSSRGVEAGPAGEVLLAVEARSPGDETWDKVGFYADAGVAELLVVDVEERTVTLLVRAGDRLVRGDAVEGSWFASGTLPGVRFGTVRRVDGSPALAVDVRGTVTSI